MLESEFENTIILSGVQGCTLTDLEFSYFYTQYFKISELEMTDTYGKIMKLKIGKYFLTPAPINLSSMKTSESWRVPCILINLLAKLQ